MLLPSVRRLTLHDVSGQVLRELIDHGESLFVERKRKPPVRPRFGAAVAAFANTLGGWLLLGVDDDGTVVGWDPPGGTDIQSHLAELLRHEVDPLPPIVASMRSIDGISVGVVRVFESSAAPHVVRGTGAIYLRSSRGKEPVPLEDQRILIELARRGESAGARARERAVELPAVGQLLRLPGSPHAPEDANQSSEIRVVVTGAPLTVTPAFREWPLTRMGAEACQRQAVALAPAPRLPYGREGPTVEHFGRAAASRVIQSMSSATQNQALVVADSGGVVGAELSRGVHEGDRVWVPLNALFEEELRPLAHSVAALLAEAEAFGEAAFDVWLVVVANTEGESHVVGGDPGGLRPLHAAGTITIPADADEVEALATGWHREIQRGFGIVKFEREPDS